MEFKKAVNQRELTKKQPQNKIKQNKTHKIQPKTSEVPVKGNIRKITIL